MISRPSPTQANASELSLIQAIRNRAKTRFGTNLRVGIGDDCAVLRFRPSEEVVVTTDLSLEGVHFRRDWHSPESIGHRCLARGLSDVAAMGAKPVAAFVSLAVPRALSQGKESWITRFYDGLLELASQHDVPLAGGDLAQSPELVTADIVLVGAVARGKALLRSGAQAGDAIYVTGALGGSAAELLALQRHPRKFARATSAEAHPHLYPQPRLAVGRELVRRGLATSALDISDGLSTDLHHLCEESKLAAEIDAAALPINVMASLAACAGLADAALELALHGGEDYELLFTAPSTANLPAKIAGVPIHRIGTMKRNRLPQINIKQDGKAVPIEPKGWEHFSSKQ
jgi:thiamine-monophosphate kinase